MVDQNWDMLPRRQLNRFLWYKSTLLGPWTNRYSRIGPLNTGDDDEGTGREGMTTGDGDGQHNNKLMTTLLAATRTA